MCLSYDQERLERQTRLCIPSVREVPGLPRSEKRSRADMVNNWDLKIKEGLMAQKPLPLDEVGLASKCAGMIQSRSTYNGPKLF